MDWGQSKVSYYADFILVPLLIAASLPYANLWWAPAGFAAWTLVEWLLHRYVFHVWMRRQHWLHHIRPSAFIAAPGWLTAGLHIIALSAAFTTGWVGAFAGFELGYLAYIITHDAIHHGAYKVEGSRWTWLGWRASLHHVHHRGVEANFGVITSYWDLMFGTLCHPHKADAWLKHQRQQRQNLS